MILKRLNVEVVATTKEEVERLKSEGYEPIKTDPAEFEEQTEEDIASLTLKELRALAASRGFKLSSALKKQDIIDILEGGNDGGTED